jgi:hypothetical protein
MNLRKMATLPCALAVQPLRLSVRTHGETRGIVTGESRNSIRFARFASNNNNRFTFVPFVNQESPELTAAYQGLLTNIGVISPTIVNQFRFGFGKFDAGADIPPELYVPGAEGVGGLPPLAPAGRGIQGVSLTNELSGFGSNSNIRFLNRNVALQCLDNVSAIRRDRSYRFGEIRRGRYSQLGVCLTDKKGGS